MEVKGYAYIKDDADCQFAMGETSDWQGEIVRVMEFNDHSQSILVVNSKANAMATFDYKDMKRHFKCEEVGNVLVAPGIQEPMRTLEAMKRLNRKGGYCGIVKNMVIHASIHRNEFNDNFLFEKQ